MLRRDTGRLPLICSERAIALEVRIQKASAEPRFLPCLEVFEAQTGLSARSDGSRDFALCYFCSVGVGVEAGGGACVFCWVGGAGFEESVIPFSPSLKPFNPSPNPLPNSGSRLAPNSKNATMASTIKCHGCSKSPICSSTRRKATRRTSSEVIVAQSETGYPSLPDLKEDSNPEPIAYRLNSPEPGRQAFR